MVNIHVNPSSSKAAHCEEAAPALINCTELQYLKKRIAAKNDELYSLQVQVLQAAWDAPGAASNKPFLQSVQGDSPRTKALVARAAQLENETQELFERYQAAREAVEATQRAKEGQMREDDKEEVPASRDKKCQDATDFVVGDTVAVVAVDDECLDDFSHGEVGSVIEVDSTIPYPYRVESQESPSKQGYFKAQDLKHHADCPQSSFSPYTPRREALILDEIDLEKGLARGKKHIEPTIQQQVKNFVLSVNPLAIC